MGDIMLHPSTEKEDQRVDEQKCQCRMIALVFFRPPLWNPRNAHLSALWGRTPCSVCFDGNSALSVSLMGAMSHGQNVNVTSIGCIRLFLKTNSISHHVWWILSVPILLKSYCCRTSRLDWSNWVIPIAIESHCILIKLNYSVLSVELSGMSRLLGQHAIGANVPRWPFHMLAKFLEVFASLGIGSQTVIHFIYIIYIHSK